MSDIPAGFAPIERRQGPFNTLIGPLHQRRDGERFLIGLRIEDKHTNSQGICHGGVLATLADLALGYAMIGKVLGDASFVTVNLSIDYAGSAMPGDWVESDVEVQRAGSRMAFCNGYLKVGDKRIVRMSAVFALAGKKA
jgi:acyl-coenzyme A thioesterase 13